MYLLPLSQVNIVFFWLIGWPTREPSFHLPREIGRIQSGSERQRDVIEN
jgi:hypothetical protein